MRLATLADKAALEAIIADPRLRTWTAFDGADPAADATRYLTAPSFAVIGDEGCFLAHCIGPGRYVVHTNLLPSCRGLEALRAGREALRIAFLETDCVELVSMCPANMPHTLWFARALGWHVSFARRGFWPAQGRRWDMTFVEMGIDDWIRTGACAERGRWFHDKLGEQQSHGEDQMHDAYVGAAAELIARGRVVKGIAIYNRFAVFAMYQTIRVLSERPLRIDMRSHVLRVEEGDFNVEACHA